MIRALALCASLLPAPLAAQGLEALTQPGMVALMRHALAPGTGDPAGFQIDDCATQRTLNDVGRAQARAAGAELREAGVVFDQIWASLWCRTFETAELMGMGPVTPFPPLNSFFRIRDQAAAQTEDLRQSLAKLNPEARVLLVTHQVNITALTDVFPQSGEIVILQRKDDRLTVVDRVQIEP